MDIIIFDGDETRQTTLDREKAHITSMDDVHTGEATAALSYPVTQPEHALLRPGSSIVAFDGLEWRLYDIYHIRNTLVDYATKKEALCEHRFYELISEPVRTVGWVDVNIDDALVEALDGSRWNVGHIAPLVMARGGRDAVYIDANPLALIKEIEMLWDCEARFRVAMTETGDFNFFVDINDIGGEFKGKRFEEGYNIYRLESNIDNRDLVTALYGRRENFMDHAYDEGDEHVVMAEGYRSPEAYTEFSKEDDYISLVTKQEDAEAGAVTDTMVDVTNLNTLHLDYERNGTAGVIWRVYLVLSKVKDGNAANYDYGGWSAILASGDGGTYQINVEEAEGLYYIRVHIFQVGGTTGVNQECKIKKIYADQFFLDLNFRSLDKLDSPVGYDYITDEDARLIHGKPDGSGGRKHRFGIYTSTTATTQEDLYNETKRVLGRSVYLSNSINVNVADIGRIRQGQETPVNATEIRAGDVVYVITKDSSVLFETRILRLNRDWNQPDVTQAALGEYVRKSSDNFEDIAQRVTSARSGRMGLPGRGIDFDWQGTELGIKYTDKGMFEYPEDYKDLKGDPATVTVDSTTTGEPGTDASVANIGTLQDAVLKFTIPRGDKGEQGDKVELQVTATHIQWRYEGGVWQNLIALEALEGTDGADGTEIELQKTATYIQWRYVGGSWVNLVALSEIKGADGTEVELQKTATHIQWRYVGGVWQDLVALSELKGTDGADGTEIELQKSETHIQWRYVGGSWANLVALSEIKGDPGESGLVTAICARKILSQLTLDDTDIDEAYHYYLNWNSNIHTNPSSMSTSADRSKIIIPATGIYRVVINMANRDYNETASVSATIGFRKGGSTVKVERLNKNTLNNYGNGRNLLDFVMYAYANDECQVRLFLGSGFVSAQIQEDFSGTQICVYRLA